MAPPPLPDKLKRVGIPVVGGLSLAGSMSCGPEGVDERDFLGSWNLVEIRYIESYSRPQVNSYEYEGQPCTYFRAQDLEVDSATSARFVRQSGHIGCHGNEVERIATQMVAEIRSDGVLELTYADEADDPYGGTGGLARTVVACERRPDHLICIIDAVVLIHARPECDDTSECPASESCIARQCVPLETNTLATTEPSERLTGLSDETGP